MTLHRYCLAIALLLALSQQSASADVLKYAFSMDGPTEFPVNPSLGVGSALVTIDTVLSTMRVEAEFSDLSGTTTVAHIHCCNFDANLIASVATRTPSFIGFPVGVTSGTMDDLYDMTLASSYRAGFITDNGGTTTGAFNALLGGLADGKAYFNIHTSTSPGGEIRGFAVRVPEPSGVLLMVTGLAVLAPVCGRQVLRRLSA